jgi:hypothetical protein
LVQISQSRHVNERVSVCLPSASDFLVAALLASLPTDLSLSMSCHQVRTYRGEIILAPSILFHVNQTEREHLGMEMNHSVFTSSTRHRPGQSI